MATESTPPTGRRVLGNSAQRLALVIGVAYIAIAIGGFIVTRADNIGFVAPEGALLFGFEVNDLHNLVHLATGIAGVTGAGSRFGARLYGWALVALYGPTFVYGLFVAGSDERANFLALNIPDNLLHVVSALAGLALALWLGRPDEAA